MKELSCILSFAFHNASTSSRSSRSQFAISCATTSSTNGSPTLCAWSMSTDPWVFAWLAGPIVSVTQQKGCRWAKSRQVMRSSNLSSLASSVGEEKLVDSYHLWSTMHQKEQPTMPSCSPDDHVHSSLLHIRFPRYWKILAELSERTLEMSLEVKQM